MKEKNNKGMSLNIMVLVNDHPSFSVLMSVYKSDIPEYLDTALKSVEKQTVKPKEIILVEDGPISKKIRSVIDRHVRESTINFKNIRLKRNHGLGEALRIGTSYVSTNWVARMDSDDYSVPSRFEEEMNYIKKNPNVAIVGGQIKEFAGNIQNIVGERRVPLDSKNIKKFMKWRSPFNHPTVMINKEVLEKVGGYITYGNLEDYYLWSRIIVSNKQVRNLKKVLVLMRVDKGMYSRRGKFSNLKYFYSLRKFLRFKRIIDFKEELIGDFIMTFNIISPEIIRKFVYQKVIHKL